MPNILVLYASTHGHTAKFAAHLARRLEEGGAEVHLRDPASARNLVPADFDGVVIAGSVHAGRHQHELVEYVSRHHDALNSRPTAFVSVSLTAADDTDEAHVETPRMIDAFLEKTDLAPQMSEPVAGCLQYREYDFMTRLLLRVITRKHPEAHDMSRDHEYTDWDRLDAFVAEFAGRVAASAPVAG